MASQGDSPGLEFDLLAAALRANSADTRVWVSALGQKLAGAFPGRVRLHHGGIFGNGPVDGLSADLDAWRFALRLDQGQPVAERTHIVRGVALKTERQPLDAWVDALSEALARVAATSERERAAIERLLL